jgi:hypothetical protein
MHDAVAKRLLQGFGRLVLIAADCVGIGLKEFAPQLVNMGQLVVARLISVDACCLAALGLFGHPFKPAGVLARKKKSAQHNAVNSDHIAARGHHSNLTAETSAS